MDGPVMDIGAARRTLRWPPLALPETGRYGDGMRAALALLGLTPSLAAAAGCGSSGAIIDLGDGAEANTSSDSGGDTGPSCAWPASLNPTDASDGRCVASRAYLSCKYSNGTTELCVSDSLTQCSGPPQSANGTDTCQNQCDAGEYAIGCGGAGLGGPPQPAPPPPPASCRILGGVEGVSFGCCPCGS